MDAIFSSKSQQDFKSHVSTALRQSALALINKNSKCKCNARCKISFDLKYNKQMSPSQLQTQSKGYD